jgi:hypothetical protein
LIAKIYGVFTLKSPIVREVNVLLMENTIAKSQNSLITAEFDLKGSTVDRESKVGSSGLKDVNLIKML